MHHKGNEMTTDMQRLAALAKDKTVLYVEDEVCMRKEIGAYLGGLFKDVIIAKDGIEGLEKYNPDIIDLVITEISMLKEGGLGMIRDMKCIHPEQETLVVSEPMSTGSFFDSIHLGVDGYIVKPIKKRELYSQLMKTLTKIEIREQADAYESALEAVEDEKDEHAYNLLQEKIENHHKALISLVELIEEKDSYTAGHSLRVANYSKVIAQELGCSEDECKLIYEAGILHDIGKIDIPDSVLLKSEQFRGLESELIKQHIDVGVDLLARIPIYKDHLELIRCHHERYDGKGYPNGLKANDIPKLARIMMVADAFDAMTTNRHLERRKSTEEALEELQRSSFIQFHPEVVEVVAKTLSKIRLDDDIFKLEKDEAEKERSAYFYKDQITGAYNHTFLEMMLTKCEQEHVPCHLLRVSIDDIASYDQEFGWSKGDMLLSEVSNHLQNNFYECKLFRVYEDKFVLLSSSDIDARKQEFNNSCFSDKYDMTISTKLFFSGVPDREDIENLDKIIYI
jgi:putative nucleotidyltransferase with HDIG domain